MLQVTVGLGMPSASQTSVTVSFGMYTSLSGSLVQYGAAAHTQSTTTGTTHKLV